MSLTLFIISFLFLFGLIIGSFLYVVIERTIHGESPAEGRSKCPHCDHMIAWYDNIPLLSYVMLRGRCRHCHKEISWHYPAIELLTGTLFVWWYLMGSAFFRLSQEPARYIQPMFWLLIGIFLLIIVVTDWLYQIIPDYANISIGLLSIAYRWYLSATGNMRYIDFWYALAAGLVVSAFFFAIWYATKGKGLGFGDVKYVLVMGWLLGWERTIVATFLAFAIGALVGLGLIYLRGRTAKSQVAFGPFLVLGTVISLLWGMPIWHWYLGFLG